MIPMLRTVLTSILKRPATVAYPLAPKENDPLVRGQVSIDIAQCIFCGLCKRKCPTGALAVDRAAKSWSIDRFDCIQCGGCVEACPKKCLHMVNTLTRAGERRPPEEFVNARVPDNPGNT